jgi:hypothetical protein
MRRRFALSLLALVILACACSGDDSTGDAPVGSADASGGGSDASAPGDGSAAKSETGVEGGASSAESSTGGDSPNESSTADAPEGGSTIDTVAPLPDGGGEASSDAHNDAADAGAATVDAQNAPDAPADVSIGDAAPLDAGADGSGIDAGSAIDAPSDDALGSGEAGGEADGGPADGAATVDAGPDVPPDVDVSTGTLLLLGAGGSALFTGELHPGSSWGTGTLPDTSDDRPAVALMTSSSGIGVIRSASHQVRFTAWTPGHFGALTDLGATVTTSGAPSLAATADRVDLVYQGNDLKHYFGSYAASSWNITAEPIGTGIDQSFGPTPASIALLGTSSVAAYASSTGQVTDRTRAGAAWQAVHALDLDDAGNVVEFTPTIVAPVSGPELLVAYVRSPGQEIAFATRSSGVWSTPDVLPGAYTTDPVSLVAVTGGDVILVYRSVDGHGFWARYSNGSWSNVTGLPWVDVEIPSTPALAPGLGGVDAEIAFVDAASGAAMHARLTGSTWSDPVTVGGAGLTSVGLASAP